MKTLKPWGAEEVWADTPHYLGKFLTVYAGKRLSRQYHREKTETLVLLHGDAILVVEPEGRVEAVVMEVGVGVTVPAGQVHRLIAVHDSFLAEVSTPHNDDVVRLDDDYGREPL